MMRELSQVKAEAETNIPPLVSGIVQDTQTLFRQEVALAKAELKSELVTAKEAAVGMSASLALAGLATLMLSFGLVHLLSWAFAIPLGASFGIVGLLYGVGAAVSFSLGRSAAEKTDFVPHQTIETMKENARWIAAGTT